MRPASLAADIIAGLSFSIWLTVPLGFVIFNFASLFLLPWSAIAVSAALQAVLIYTPLTIPAPKAALSFLAYSCHAFQDYCPIRFVFEDKDAMMSEKGPVVLAYEPHNVLPLGMCLFLSLNARLPRAFARAHPLLGASCFQVPILRHLFWWSGCRPAARSVMADILSDNGAVVICPGGVAECVEMRKGEEVCYLKNRTGFVRLSLHHGATLVPVFAFNQISQFGYWRPCIDPPFASAGGAEMMRGLSRKIKFMPLLPLGVLGMPVPKKAPITVVVGKPIKLPTIEHPSAEEVQKHLDEFIGAVEGLYKKYATKYGPSTTPALRIC